MAYYDQPQFSRPILSKRHSSFGGPSHNFPPYNDQFRNNSQYNDQFDNNQFDEFSNGAGFQENFPPMNGGGFSQPFPSAGPMQQAYSRDQRPSPPDAFGSMPNVDPFGPPAGRTPYNDSFHDSPLSDNYFPPGGMDQPRSRTLSSGGYGAGALITAPPLAQYPSQYNRRSRRSSTSAAFGPGPTDSFRGYDGMHIKFRVKGSYQGGVSLGEAMSNVRLSNSSAYTFQDLKADRSGRITLRVRWSGYSSLTYEIPISGYDDGRSINLGSLARRVSRAVVHFLTANAINIPWDRVIIHRLEETSFGVWMPILTAH